MMRIVRGDGIGQSAVEGMAASEFLRKDRCCSVQKLRLCARQVRFVRAWSWFLAGAPEAKLKRANSLEI
jgi:hypothetical protein